MTERSTRKCRVFIVDDERVIASTIAVILRQHGFEACEFFSAESALIAIREHTPDVLISDLVMPGMTGVELALEVRRSHPECKVMLFSGHIDTSVLMENARRQGFTFPVHTKPVLPDRLLEMMENVRLSLRETLLSGSINP